MKIAKLKALQKKRENQKKAEEMWLSDVNAALGRNFALTISAEKVLELEIKNAGRNVDPYESADDMIARIMGDDING